MATPRRKYDPDYFMHQFSNEHERNSDKEYESRDKDIQARVALVRAKKQQTGKALRRKELDDVFQEGKHK